MKKLFVRLFLAMLILSTSAFIAEAAARTYKTNLLGVSMQLARRDPVKGLIFVCVKDGVFEAYSMTSHPYSLIGVPYNRVCGAFTVFPDALATAKLVWDEADRTGEMDCRYTYVESKPMLNLNLRFENGNMAHYEFVSLKNDGWKLRIAEYLAAEAITKGGLSFDWRPVYLLTILKSARDSIVLKKAGIDENGVWMPALEKSGPSRRVIDDVITYYYERHTNLAPEQWNKDYDKALVDEKLSLVIDEVLRLAK